MFKNNTIGWNTLGKPEAVLTNDQRQLFSNFKKSSRRSVRSSSRSSRTSPQAGLEILGLDGTPLDRESNRYLKAG